MTPFPMHRFLDQCVNKPLTLGELKPSDVFILFPIDVSVPGGFRHPQKLYIKINPESAGPNFPPDTTFTCCEYEEQTRLVPIPEEVPVIALTGVLPAFIRRRLQRQTQLIDEEERPPDPPHLTRSSRLLIEVEKFAKECVQQMEEHFGIGMKVVKAVSLYRRSKQLRDDYPTCGFDTSMREYVSSMIAEEVLGTGQEWPANQVPQAEQEEFFGNLFRRASKFGYTIDKTRYPEFAHLG